MAKRGAGNKPAARMIIAAPAIVQYDMQLDFKSAPNLELIQIGV